MVVDGRRSEHPQDAGGEQAAAGGSDATSDADVRPPAPPSLDTAALERIIKATASVLAPVTVLTALLFYFGFARTNALYSSFGIDASTLGFSTQDYLVRSVEAVYVPAGILILTILLLLWLHQLVSQRLADPARKFWLPPAAVVFGIAGLLLFARGIAGVALPSLSNGDFLVTPLCLGSGTLFIAYALHIRRRLRAPQREPEAERAALTRGVNLALVILLVLLSVFWMATNYAKAYGRGFASQLSQRLDRQPSVVIYSTDRLYLHGNGIVEQTLPASGGAYHYRYEGLRLLIYSRGRYFLLPEGWDRSRDPTIVLPDAGSLRFEFKPGGT
jgi:hypothetical protein